MKDRLSSFKSLIPFYGDRKVRKQIDKIFSRQVLGAILLGKFIGDYAAIMSTRMLGTDLGYLVGSATILITFVYWEQLEDAAKEGADMVKEAAEDTDEDK